MRTDIELLATEQEMSEFQVAAVKAAYQGNEIAIGFCEKKGLIRVVESEDIHQQAIGGIADV